MGTMIEDGHAEGNEIESNQEPDVWMTHFL